jgi:hypothetical protein
MSYKNHGKLSSQVSSNFSVGPSLKQRPFALYRIEFSAVPRRTAGNEFSMTRGPKGQNKERKLVMRKPKILPIPLISVGALFALTQLLTAATEDGVWNFSKTPFVRPQPTIIIFDAPGAGTGGPFQGTLVAGINPAGVIAGGFLMRTRWNILICAFPMALSLRSTRPVRAQGRFKARAPTA